MRKITWNWGLLSVIATGMALAIPSILHGCPRSTYDGQGHVNWVECFSRQLWGGEVYPRWFSSPNDGFGTPAFFFYGPLAYYVAAFFWRFAPLDGQAGFAIGWAAAVALVLSGVATYWCLRRFAISKWSAALGAIVYLAAPYHLATDLWDRGANAEFWGFVWMPLVIGSLEGIARNAEPTISAADGGRFQSREDTRGILTLAVWLACLLLTHVLTVIIFAPVAAGFAMYRGWRTSRGLLIAGVIALGLTAIYWLPLVSYGPYIRGSYWKIDIESTMFYSPLSPTNNAVYNRSLDIFHGFVAVFALGVLAVWSLKPDRQADRSITYCVCLLGGCLVMMVPVSLPIYNIISPLQHIQFSWRFMACATLAHSLLAAFLLDAFWKPSSPRLDGLRLRAGRAAGVVVLVIALYLGFAQGEAMYGKAFSNHDVPVIARVSQRDARGEYIPIGLDEDEARRLFPNAGTGTSMPRILEGAGKVAGTAKNARHWMIDMEATSPCKIVIPQFWFPGWKAYDARAGEDFAVRKEPKSGLVELAVPSGRHAIDLRLGAIGPEFIGRLASLGTACGLGLTAAFLVFKTRTGQSRTIK